MKKTTFYAILVALFFSAISLFCLVLIISHLDNPENHEPTICYISGVVFGLSLFTYIRNHPNKKSVGYVIRNTEIDIFVGKEDKLVSQINKAIVFNDWVDAITHLNKIMCDNKEEFGDVKDEWLEHLNVRKVIIDLKS